jgi:A/G-specific adenine glycosylase
VDALLAVPGLGLYTAVAIAAFAYAAPEVPADVNILRFLSRLTGLPMTHPTKGSAELRALLTLLSEAEGGPTPEALLDFTRLVCRPRRPLCEDCPVQAVCAHFMMQGEPSAPP